MSSISLENLRLSSATSILSGLVPRTLVFVPLRAFSRSTARLTEVWPPYWQITPSASSASMTFRTSPRVRGSKYSLSDMS